MRSVLTLFILVFFCACKKNEKAITGCNPNAATTRTITNKKAFVKLTATATYPVYLIEEGTIDTKLVPCNVPMEYYQDGLQVIISGEVKASAPAETYGPCCMESFTITSITK